MKPRNQTAAIRGQALFLFYAVSAVYGQRFMWSFDDFEGGTNQNFYGNYWFFYNDSRLGGTSQITNADTSGGELVFTGGYEPGYNSNYCGRIDFILGPPFPDPAPGATWDIEPFVGMSSRLITDGRTRELTGTTSVSFWAMASPAMTGRFKVETSDITNHAYYGINLDITSSWRPYDIPMFVGPGALEQPHWSQSVARFNLRNSQIITWEISGDYNENITEGSFLVDDIYFSDRISSGGVISNPDPSQRAISFSHSGSQIRYTVMEGADVVFDVFNLMGRRVYRYISGNRAPGLYSFTPTIMPSSGAYLVEMKAGRNVVRRKITVQR